MKLNSDNLQITQNVLEQLAKNEIDDSMTNHSKLKRLLAVVQEIDLLRRETWNKEKFGESSAIVELICPDDIPF